VATRPNIKYSNEWIFDLKCKKFIDEISVKSQDIGEQLW